MINGVSVNTLSYICKNIRRRLYGQISKFNLDKPFLLKERWGHKAIEDTDCCGSGDCVSETRGHQIVSVSRVGHTPPPP